MFPETNPPRFPGPPLLAAVLVLSTAGALVAADRRPFPEPRPTSRGEAVQLLCPAADAAGVCVRQLLRPSATADPSAAVHRSLDLLARDLREVGTQEWTTPQGIRVRYIDDPRSIDRVDPADADQDGVPDVVDAVADALDRARALLAGQLELPAPQVREIVMVELGDRVGGYVLPGGTGMTLVLEASPPGGALVARRAAVRQYAYATALGLGAAPAEWIEAFAAWAETRLLGLDSAGATTVSARLRDIGRGLLAGRPELDAGNAIWFSFLDQAYGLAAVRVTLEELCASSPPAAALDRALRRAASLDLASAFREFHVWAVLTGDRADGHHFDFARRLEFPGFAATATGVPALSVQREPALGPLGAAQIRLVPLQSRGGLRVRFEGDFGARWDADLLLVDRSGSMHRVALPLTSEGRGEISVPLQHVDELLLLVRNVDSDDGAARQYTYSAHHEPEFPFALSAMGATRADEPGGGVVVAWDTVFEQDLIGFNVLRRRTDSAVEQPINPVWVPALGALGEETSYRFVDRDADPDAEYVYRIQGLTSTGLSAYSDKILVAPRPVER